MHPLTAIGREGSMLRLTRDEFEEIPETYQFPVEEARAIATRVDIAPGTDRGACEAARRVEDALRSVELNFERLRGIMGYDDGDDDRPRAA
jgi:hypothetical protein